MRKISAAKSEASSPPVPARISRMTFFSSLGSLGSSRTLSSSSRAGSRGSSAAISSCGHGAQVGVGFGEHGARFGQALAHLLEFAVLLDGRLRFRAALGRLFWYFSWSLRTSGRRELRLQLVVALFHLFQAIDHHDPLRGFQVLEQ